MNLIQFLDAQNTRRVGIINPDQETITAVAQPATIRELALSAHRAQATLADHLSTQPRSETFRYDELLAIQRVLPPLDHPDPAHCLVTGTGLTHLGSAQSRDAMHAKLQADTLTDSMKMFKLGLEGGKPAPGEIGVAPEWFYKGDGSCVVAPEASIELPAFAEDGGEESEIVGLYVIGDQGEPLRVGFALGNEYSDHKLERQNYLYLAHSKLRQCSFGPELYVGALPDHIEGHSRIVRNNETIWESKWLSGEENMSHTIANLEHHHFKYAQFRRPSDVHVHYFGAAVLSCLSGIVAEPGDRFEIEALGFGKPLRNSLVASIKDDTLVGVAVL
ncbi:MAG TPA: AraD1 family protein [Blastocatellia bacterium]|nr:AraD1 family protein [Blastocatellia bacterium]